MDPSDSQGRLRVYVAIKRGPTTMLRVLDLAYLAHDQPVAVLSWVKVEGALRPGRYIQLEPNLLRKAAPVGTFQYIGVVEDPAS